MSSDSTLAIMSLSIGSRIGPYDVLAPLGRGGMGEVYRARDSRLGRLVAIKVLSGARNGSPASVERFQREARTIARLSHAHICTVHDVGDQDGVPFLVMELLEGETLSDHLEGGAVPIDRTLAIATQIVDALDAAHDKGVVHRDLKPANVMLTTAGVKLLDFGIAKLREPDSDDVVRASTADVRLTDGDMVLGTLPYMAPEQIEGREVDARTDLFAFGVLLYEMVAGRPPFKGDSRAALMAAIVAADPPALDDLQPPIPRALERLIRRCLAKVPEQRWQTARDLAAELRWIAESRSGVSEPTVTSRHRGRRSILWGGLAAVTIASVSLVRFDALTPRQTPVPEYVQVTYRRGLVSSARFAPDGRTFAYTASWDGQPFEIFHGRVESPDVRSLSLQSARLLSISPASDMAVVFGPQSLERSFGERTLARIPMAGGARRDLLTGVVDADWIPGTDTFAVIRDPGANRPWTVEFPAGNPVHEAPAAWSLRASPDGSRIAFFEGPIVFDSAPQAMVTIIDRAGQKTTLSRNWSGYGLAWAPSGREVWFTATRGGVTQPDGTSDSTRSGPQLQAVSLAGEARAVDRTPDWLVLHDIAPDGTALLSRNTIRISMNCRTPLDTKERDLSWLTASVPRALSRDGSSVIFIDFLTGRTASGNPTVFRRGLDGSDAVAIGEGAPQALSPDGRWMLTRLIEDLVLLPMGAGEPQTLRKGDLRLHGGAAWLGDSHVIFTASRGGGEPRIYRQAIPDGTPVAITPEGTSSSPASVRDDRTLLVPSGSGWLLYDIEGGDPVPVPALTPRDLPIAWSDDGRFAYAVDTAVVGAARFDVVRVDVATGRRDVWKTVQPDDTAGVQVNPANFRMLPDGNTYCYSYMRRVGDLFVVRGLQ